MLGCSRCYPIKILALKKNFYHRYWELYFNYAYYTLLLPFHFKQNHQTGELTMHESSYHKMLMIVLQSFTLGTMFVPNLLTIFGPKKESTSMYAYTVNEVLTPLVNIILAIAITQNTWRLKKLYFEAFRRILRLYNEPSESSPQERVNWVPYCVFLIFFVYNIIQTTRMVIMFKGNLLEMSKTFVFDLLMIPIPEYFQIVAKYFGIVVYFYSWHIYNFMDASFLINSTLFYYIVDEFLCQTKSGHKSPGKVLQQFESLHETAEALNNALGTVIMISTLGSVPLLSTTGIQMFSREPIKGISMYLLRFCSTVTFMVKVLSLFISAKAHNSIKLMNKWAFQQEQKEYFKMNPTELQQLIHKINLNEIHLGPFGLFKIDYSFVGTFMGIVISYAVVIAQMDTSG